MPLSFMGNVQKPYSTVSIDVVEEFGAVGDNSTDNSTQLELALVELNRRLNLASANTQGELYFKHSPNPYRISRPLIIDRNNVGIVGENPSVQLNNNIGNSGPVVLFGVRTTETDDLGQTVIASSAYRPDLFGDLDSSILSSPGERWGFKTNNNATLMFEGCPGDLGPSEDPAQSTYTNNYKAVNSGFLLELAVKHSGGTAFIGGTTAGIVNLGTSSDIVFSLNRGGTTNQFDFYCSFTDGTYIQTAIGVSASNSGVFKLAYQVDLINRRMIQFHNGLQVACGSGGTFFAGSGQTSLIDNKFYSLIFGTNSIYSDGYRPPTATHALVGMDFTICGFSLSNQLCYQNLGVGQAQTRIDNGTVNDNYRFLGGGNANRNKFFLLTLLDNPSVSSTKRFVSALSNAHGGTYQGLIINNNMYTLSGGVTYNYVRNMTINGNGNNPCVVIGGTINTFFDNVNFANGSLCVNVLNLLANYTLRFDKCSFSAFNSCIKGSQSVIELLNPNFNDIARNAVKLYASNCTIERGNVYFGSNFTDTFYKSYGGLYGGFHKIDNVLIDFEGTVFREAVFYVEQNPAGVAPATTYQISNIYCGSVGSGHVVKAVQKYSNDGTNYLIVNLDNVQTTDFSYRSYLDINGDAILGTIKNLSPDIGCPMTHQETYTNECNIQIEHRAYKNLPRQHNWVANGHKIMIQNPKEGQFKEFRCVRTGRIGTSVPPIFVGCDPLVGRPNILSVYNWTHSYGSYAFYQSGSALVPEGPL